MTKVKINNVKNIREIDVQPQTVLSLLQKEGIIFNAFCGGNGKCGKCLVNVDGQKVLACQTMLKEGMTIYLDRTEETNNQAEKERIQVAMDLGTTTIVLAIYKGNNLINKLSINNPLSTFGADVISRVQYIQENKDGLLLQQKILCQKIAQAIATQGMVEKLVVSGNTIMQHIMAGISPVSIAVYPFQAKSLFQDNQEYLPPYFDNCKVEFMPCIASYVGGDIVSGMISCNFMRQQENALFMDIGTNGEIILKKGENYYSCSVAAGPAFEGTNLSCGTSDISTSITHFQFDENLIFDKENPTGISGSGYLDLLACLLNKGIVDETGRLLDPDELEECFQKYIKLDEEDTSYFRISDLLRLNNKDIRNLQMAIGATSAALATLFSLSETNLQKLDKVYISGNFGSNLNVDSIIRIGLLPSCLKEKVSQLGNSSLKGAQIMLQNQQEREQLISFCRQIDYIELSNNELFKEIYMEHMYLTEDKLWNFISH